MVQAAVALREAVHETVVCLFVDADALVEQTEQIGIICLNEFAVRSIVTHFEMAQVLDPDGTNPSEMA